MTRKIKNLIKDFSISSFNYSGGMGGGEAGIDPPTINNSYNFYTNSTNRFGKSDS